ncbi:MAG: hypothetical protein HRU50_10915 [Winogradskyella sp.]|uniref:hypothetical protein n=1 Tax=Winogradskyella sp. TaxID=1883156 RepID=UPI0025F5D5C7|nr:hypothetical protein [Winogradskyella sp.]NRB60433.1 hypothetical protein [Winogradskyella sp.]
MSNRKIFQATTLLLFLAMFINAQEKTRFNNISFNESLASVQRKLDSISENITVIGIREPNFPLSHNNETHLIATNIRFDGGNLDRAVFTFSDNRLSYIQASGNITNTLVSNIKCDPVLYLNYRFYKSHILFIDSDKDLAWQLTSESLHTNLFAWDNPYLYANKGDVVNYKQSVKVPDFLRMGGELDDLLPLLKQNSEFIEIQELDTTDGSSKTQINCFGIEFAGFPRKFEARFENGTLKKVWILTAKGEENRLRTKLTKEYGQVNYVNKDWEVFNNWTVLLRKDKPEVLLLTDDLGKTYKNQYLKQE